MIKIGTPRQWHVPPSVTLSEAKDLAGAETLASLRVTSEGSGAWADFPVLVVKTHHRGPTMIRLRKPTQSCHSRNMAGASPGPAINRGPTPK